MFYGTVLKCCNLHPLLENDSNNTKILREKTKRWQREYLTSGAADQDSSCGISLPSQDLLPFDGDEG